MHAPNAAAPKPVDGRGGRGSDCTIGKRNHFLAEKVTSRLADLPDTIMTAAFLRALRHWLSRRSDKSSRKIVIPTGVVSDAELARVLRAIFHINAPPGRDLSGQLKEDSR